MRNEYTQIKTLGPLTGHLRRLLAVQDPILLEIRETEVCDDVAAVVFEPFRPLAPSEVSLTEMAIIAKGLARLHKQGVFLGGLAPGSILSADRKIKIHRVGDITDPGFIAPEARVGQPGPASDVYSLGRWLEYLGLEVPGKLFAADPKKRPSPRRVIKLIDRQTKNRSVFRPAVAGFLSVALVLLSAFAYQSGHDWKDYLTLFEGGVNSALLQLKRGLGEAEDFPTVYAEAWVLFRGQDFTAAKECWHRLKSLARNKKNLADLQYLGAWLALNTGNKREAIEAFNRAKALYEASGDANNVHRSLLGLVDIYIKDQDYGMAQAFLEEAGHFGTQKLNLGNYYRYRATLSFFSGDYSSALQDSHKAYDAFEQRSDNLNMAYALSDAGAFYMLLGLFDKGRIATDHAQELIVDTGNRELHHYNLLNQIFFNKCNGVLFDHLVKQVLEWGEKHNNEDIVHLLEFYLEEDCPQTRQGGSSPDPPIDPPDDPGDTGSGGGGG